MTGVASPEFGNHSDISRIEEVTNLFGMDFVTSVEQNITTQARLNTEAFLEADRVADYDKRLAAELRTHFQGAGALMMADTLDETAIAKAGVLEALLLTESRVPPISRQAHVTRLGSSIKAPFSIHPLAHDHRPKGYEGLVDAVILALSYASDEIAEDTLQHQTVATAIQLMELKDIEI